MRFWMVAAVMMAGMSSAAAQVYRWTDSSGKRHFTDTPPPASARDVRTTAAGASGGDADASNEPFVLQHVRKNHPVKLYSTPGCGGGCDGARALLNARGVPFSEVSVSSDLAIAELKQVSGGASVPVLVVGRNVQTGFEQGAYHQMLDRAGYPKSGVLPRRSQGEPRHADPRSDDSTAAAAEQPGPRGPYAPR